MIDQLNDRQHKLLVKIATDRPDLVPLYKTADISSSELPDSAFADSSSRLFPIHTPEHAVLSKLYAEKQASLVDPSTRRNIDTALELHGIEPSQVTTRGHEKQASTAESHRYLLPQYKRLKVASAEDLKAGVETLINQQHRLKVATLVDSATRTLQYAAEYGMDVQDLPPAIYKYAGMTACDAGHLLDWIEARAVACSDLQQRQTFDKIARTIEDNFPASGYIRDRDELVKIASAIETADRQAGLERLYGSTLLDPIQTVFNTTKVAQEMVQLGSKELPLEELLTVPAEIYEDILGEGVLEAASDAQGNLDPGQFKALLETLPADLRTLLASTLGPYLSRG